MNKLNSFLENVVKIKKPTFVKYNIGWWYADVDCIRAEVDRGRQFPNIAYIKICDILEFDKKNLLIKTKNNNYLINISKSRKLESFCKTLSKKIELLSHE